MGVDQAIRVDYKPVRKFQEQSGLIQKTRCTTYVQAVEIKNTTANMVKLLLVDQVPISTDDKIQVKLVEPQLKNSANVKLNKANNLEFDLINHPKATNFKSVKRSMEQRQPRAVCWLRSASTYAECDSFYKLCI